MSVLNRHQWPTQLPDARTGEDFARQMHGFRDANSDIPGVKEYEYRQGEGYSAHVEGLYHQARSLDSPSNLPLAASDPKLDGFSLGELKHRDFEKNYPAEKQAGMLGKIGKGTIGPVDVYVNGRGQTRLDDGNHRVTMAHMTGVKRIPARNKWG